MNREDKIAMCKAYYDALCDGTAHTLLASLTDDPAPPVPGDPQALAVADRCDALAKREEWDECGDAIERALKEAATILRRAPKREYAPGGPRALDVARAIEARLEIAGSAGCSPVIATEDAIAAVEILRRAPKQEDVPGSPQALDVARVLDESADEAVEAYGDAANVAPIRDAAAILRRAPGPDLDALERAMREGSSIGNRCIDRLEAAIAKMRKTGGQ